MGTKARPQKVSFTQDLVAKVQCPEHRPEAVIWDIKQPGLGLRVRRGGGSRSWCVVYRPRGSKRLTWLHLARADRITLKDARAAARRALGEVAAGGDPHAQHVAQRRQITLKSALARYESTLVQRGVARRDMYTSALRRGLLEPLGDVPLTSLTRLKLVDRVVELEAAGQPGAAAFLRSRLSAFMNWCADTGLLPTNPLAGHRRPKATRLERLAEDNNQKNGRHLADHELSRWWRTVEEHCDSVFGTFLKVLLLTGQRRQETAAMRWQDLDLTVGVWTLPAATTKLGRQQLVPLPPLVLELLQALPRRARSEYVFAATSGKPIAGFSQRMERLRAADNLPPWTMHDLRRTYRTGLAALGVEHAVAELCIAHALPGGTLTGTYDRYDRWSERVEAAARWANHVEKLSQLPE